MNNQILLIYEFNKLLEILKEIQTNFSFKIKNISKNDLNSEFIKENVNNIFLTKKGVPEIKNQIILNQLPIKLFNIIEQINIKFIKIKFNQQSEIDIGKYKINLNSREMKSNKETLKLTEKECEIIIYLNNFKNPVSINELEKSVWDFNSDLETHTVETHIYRLRKKIFETFSEENFILSKKNGYQIK